MCHLNLEENSEVGSRNLIIIIYIYIYIILGYINVWVLFCHVQNVQLSSF